MGWGADTPHSRRRVGKGADSHQPQGRVTWGSSCRSARSHCRPWSATPGRGWRLKAQGTVSPEREPAGQLPGATQKLCSRLGAGRAGSGGRRRLREPGLWALLVLTPSVSPNALHACSNNLVQRAASLFSEKSKAHR